LNETSLEWLKQRALLGRIVEGIAALDGIMQAHDQVAKRAAAGTLKAPQRFQHRQARVQHCG
jgi:hypothetical protein